MAIGVAPVSECGDPEQRYSGVVMSALHKNDGNCHECEAMGLLAWHSDGGTCIWPADTRIRGYIRCDAR